MYLHILLSFFLASIIQAFSIPPPSPPTAPFVNGKRCTVLAHGNETDDTPQILAAFESCNNGGTVVFPQSENYWIGTRLNPILQDVTIEWGGVWTLSDNLTYWRENGYPIAFQNHHAGFIISGNRIHINGARSNGTGSGGIFGNGNAWYNVEQAVTQPGRPMPFVFWNVSHVKVEHVQNTDGFDTMDTFNIRLTNFVYQGGDDCIAIKPRSYNIYAQNLTCNGGNGIAIGSLGQYLEDSSVANVLVKDVNILTHNDDMTNSAYIKTWIGVLTLQTSYESAGLPRGGGWGVVENIVFENFNVQGAGIGPDINQASGANSTDTPGTSKMLVQNIVFANWTGWVQPSSSTATPRTAALSCSTVFPCQGIILQNVSLAFGEAAVETAPIGTCQFVRPGGVLGLNGTGC